MKALSSDLRKRIVDFYKKHADTTYAKTAIHFSVGEATVSRLLKLERETCGSLSTQKTTNPKCVVNFEWLQKHAEKLPDARLKDRVHVRFIEPGKLVQNAYAESFNGRFRDECLNQEWFLSLANARTTVKVWRRDYNAERPHSSLRDLSPSQFALKMKTELSNGHL